MASKRSSNTQQKKTDDSRMPKAARSVTPAVPKKGSATGDIFGVALLVAAIAMAISVVSPSSAPVTKMIGMALELCFGIGALLIPILLAVFAITFFVNEKNPISKRVAGGFALVILSILGLISITLDLAEANPGLLLEPGVVATRGGYVGGALAWLLHQLVGKTVGEVVLVGLIAAGIIISGFSISGFVTHARSKASEIMGARQTARGSDPQKYAAATQQVSGREPDGLHEEPQTSFLGARKTTVLTRGKKNRAGAKEPSATHSAPEKTTRIAEPTAATNENGARSSQLVVPDFLVDAAPSKKQKKCRGTKRGEDAPKTTVKRRDGLAEAVSRPGDDAEGYELPPFTMLSSNPNSASSATPADELDHTKERLQGTLQEFGLSSRVVDYISGPLVTTFRVEMGEGERVSRIRTLEDDIALTLAAEKVRIFAPIPGTSFVGIEIPNKERQNVYLGDVLPYATGGPLEVVIGRDSAGRPVVADIAKMPHMLVAGTTGSGKSVLINTMIMSLLMRTTPKQVRLIMIDPKRVEFSGYNGLPHLYVPVVTEPRQAASALQWAVSEMERRLKVFARAGVREIKAYNKECVSGKLSEMDNPPEPMPFLVVVIDELSDLMMVAGKDVEASIVRLAQLARAAGIHLVIATQRPSANVVTGLIKSNIDSRVALKVSSGIDSRVILDETGADRLLGYGDMLFKDRGLSPKRVLSCFTSDDEINGVVDFIRDQAEPDYHEEILSQVVPGQPAGGGSGDLDEEDDPLVWEAAQIVVDSQLGSTSGLQRRLKVGYARAGRIMDMLEAKGVVGPPDGSKPREVLLDKDGLEELRTAEAQYREV